MPELPEVETVKRGLEPAWLGKSFTNVQLNRPDLRVPFPDQFSDRLIRDAVKNTQRRGKYIIVSLKSGYSFALHLGMSGRVNIYESKQDYKPQKHDHALWTMEDDTLIVFNDPRRFGMVFEVPSDYQQHKAFASMGPEPLGNDFHGPALYEALEKRRVPIKNALLDQKVVAGVGNIYACEALYRAQIHPERMANTITSEESESLARHVRDVLVEAINSGGSTLRDYQHTDGSLGYFQHRFDVYDQEGRPCQRCGDPVMIQRIIQSGRSTFFCASCQK